MKKFLLTLLFILCFDSIFLPTGGVFAEQIDINSATLSQLDELAGIGPTYAQRIIDARPFSSVDDLDRVKGIGPATLQKIKTQGFACVNCQATQTIVQPQNTPVPTLVTTQPPDQTPNTTITYPSGIFINEIMPNPQGADETDEWIELYNPNNFDVDLSGWRLQDATGTVTTFSIPTNNPSTSSGQAKILAGGFLVFKRPETNIMLNNDADGLNLITPDKKTIDSVNFTSAPLGQSYNKVGSLWQWSTSPTPGAINIIATPIAAKALPKVKNSVKNKAVEPALADISQAINTNQDNNTLNPWFLFLSALAITIISATVVLLVKLKFRKTKPETIN